jgi:hypothetical protein
MKPGASVARRSRVKPAAEAITRSVELRSDTELSHAEPEVRIHLPPAKSLRTIGSSFGGRPAHLRARRNLNKKNGKGEEALVTLCEPC